MKAFVLKCPQCGAQLEGNRTRCEHCGTSVRLSQDKQEFVGLGIACPQCGGTNQNADKHCGSCGTALTFVCPSPSCNEENSVWRKFCRKCGRDIVGYQISVIEEFRRKANEEIQQHRVAIDGINQTLPASKGRVVLVRSIIGVVGAFVVLALFDAHWFWGVISAVVTASAVYFYESSEIENLQSALALYTSDLAQLEEKYEASEAELARVSSAAE